MGGSPRSSKGALSGKEEGGRLQRVLGRGVSTRKGITLGPETRLFAGPCGKTGSKKRGKKEKKAERSWLPQRRKG